MSSLIKLRRSAGLPPARGMSAAALRASNPALARKWSSFIEANKPAIARGIVARIS
jgi:hypothetical protein